MPKLDNTLVVTSSVITHKTKGKRLEPYISYRITLPHKAVKWLSIGEGDLITINILSVKRKR